MCVHSAWPPLSVGHGPEHLNSPANTYYQSPPSDNNRTLFGDATLGQGTFGTWSILPSTSMVDSVTGLRYAECSRAPDYVTNVKVSREVEYVCLPAVSA